MAGFGLTTGMRTDGGPGGCLTSRAHIAGMGTDEGPGGLLTSRAHVAGVETDEGPGLRTSRAHAGVVQGNGGLPADPWMEYILRQQQQQQGGPGGVQQGCLGATGHWVNRTQFVPVPPSVSSRSGSTAIHFTLLTPHFTLWTLHSSLHTLHSALYTIHPTLST